MRDPRRIQPILELLAAYWMANPELRLCQLLANCFPGRDIYYYEDDVLEAALKETYGKPPTKPSGKA